MVGLEKFASLGLSENILEALQEKGFTEPTAIQERTIPMLLSGEKNVIGQAQTGSGKTAAFGLPILEKLSRNKSGNPHALILSPTRELSMQIAAELNSLKGEHSNLRVASFFGGQYIGIQLNILRDGVDVAIGTPGRIMDLMERGKLIFDELEFAVLDEADEMLDMGFIDDIRSILSKTPEKKRMLMFSATMPPEILSIAESFMGDYEIVRTETEMTSPEQTKQIWFDVRRENKLEALSRVIDREEDLYAMVFCRTKTDVDELAESLTARGYSVDSLHGDLAQAQRTRVINAFKRKQFKLLIATDVAARGIDVNDLTHVINFSIPQTTEAYIHRIGRTGRAGKEGTAITFVTPGERKKLDKIRRETKMDIIRENIPGGEEIMSVKKRRYAALLTQNIASGEYESMMDFAKDLLAIADDPAEVLASALKERFHNELDSSVYTDLSSSGRGRGDKADSVPRGKKVKVELPCGKMDGVGVVELLKLFTGVAGIGKRDIGRIYCGKHRSEVELYENEVDAVLRKFASVPDAPEIRKMKETLPEEAVNLRNEILSEIEGESASGNSEGNEKGSSDTMDRRERYPMRRGDGKPFRSTGGRSRKSDGAHRGFDRKGKTDFHRSGPHRGFSGRGKRPVK